MVFIQKKKLQNIDLLPFTLIQKNCQVMMNQENGGSKTENAVWENGVFLSRTTHKSSRLYDPTVINSCVLMCDVRNHNKILVTVVVAL